MPTNVFNIDTEISGKLTLGGTSDVVISTTGNVGIGVALPSTKLEVSGVITATGGTSTNWNTAYGWGDHAAVGYLTSFTETDPVFSASPAAGITSTNISNWNTAYGWGNHATAGYLTSYTETDTLDSVTGRGNTTANNINVGPSLHVGQNISTATAYVQLGNGRTGNGYAYLDLVGDTTYTDYGLRVIRYNTGANAASDIVHRGTGQLSIISNEAAPILFKTTAAERMRILPAGQVAIGRTTAFTVGGTATLSVNGDIISWGNSSTDLSYFRRLSTGNFQWQTYNGANAGNIHLQPYGGNVGIATTAPKSTAHIDGVLTLEGGARSNPSAGINEAVVIDYQLSGTSLGRLRSRDWDNGVWKDFIIQANDITLDAGGAMDLQTSALTWNSNTLATQSWVTSQNYLTSYTETDTLATVTSRGSSTTNSITLGATSTNGSVLAYGTYSNGNIIVLGGVRSSGGPMIGYGLKPDTATSHGFVSSSGATLTRGAYYINGNEHRWYSGGGQTSVIGGAVSISQNMTLNSSGNLGIGTTSPASKLDVNGAITFEGDTEHQIQKVTTSAVTSAVTDTTQVSGRQIDLYAYDDVWLRAGSADDIGFVAGGSTQMFIDGSTSRVGIGTTSPSRRLDVDGIQGWQLSNLETAYLNPTATGADFALKDQNNANIIRLDSRPSAVSYFNGGNVGIGTTSPSTNLQTGDGSAGVDTSIRAYHSDGAYTEIRGYGLLTNRTTAYIRPTGDKNAVMAIGNDNNTWNYVNVNANYFTVGTDATEHMRITNTGNVGIGTTSPSEKLDVVGKILAQSSGYVHVRVDQTDSGMIDMGLSSGTAEGFLNIQNTGAGHVAANPEFKLLLNSSEKIRIDGSGNVGIGTTSPDVKLEVVAASPTDGIVADFVNSTNAGGTVAAIKLSNADSEACDVVLGANRVGANFGSDFFISLSDGVDGTNQERLRITESGNVGIGTTSPSGKLHIQTDASSEFIFTGASTSGYATTFHMDNTGLDIGHNSASRSLNLKTGGLDRLTIAGGGNVGIGTTSPSEKLEVSGNILASGDITAFSDANLKENVETVFDALDKVKGMRGVTFNKIGEEKRSVGVIAQELLEVLPEAVHKSGEHYSVAYGNIVGVLIEAMKEQQKQIEKLKSMINGFTK